MFIILRHKMVICGSWGALPKTIKNPVGLEGLFKVTPCVNQRLDFRSDQKLKSNY